jgi:hypothetical protein
MKKHTPAAEYRRRYPYIQDFHTMRDAYQALRDLGFQPVSGRDRVLRNKEVIARVCRLDDGNVWVTYEGRE